MKKIVSAILSIVTAGLTFVFLAIPCLTHSIADKSVSSWNGYKILSEFTSDFKCFSLYQIFIIATMILAGLIIIFATLMLLQELKIIKTNLDFNFITSMLLCLYTVGAIVSMIAIIGLANSISYEEARIVYDVDFGLIFPWVLGLVTTVSSFVLARNKN